MSEFKNSIGEISELLDVLSKKSPEVVTNLLNTIYSPKAAENLGKAVGAFYKELVESGISEDIAAKMSENYMQSIGNVLKSEKF